MLPGIRWMSTVSGGSGIRWMSTVSNGSSINGCRSSGSGDDEDHDDHDDEDNKNIRYYLQNNYNHIHFFDGLAAAFPNNNDDDYYNENGDDIVDYDYEYG